MEVLGMVAVVVVLVVLNALRLRGRRRHQYHHSYSRSTSRRHPGLTLLRPRGGERPSQGAGAGRGDEKFRLDTSGDWPLLRKPLLERSEMVLFHRLAEALPEHVVLSQVALQSFIKVRPGERHERPWRWKYDKKTVDFLVCDQNFEILAAIELDGGSHRSEEQAERDRDKAKALATAGVRLIRLTPDKLPNGVEIRQRLGIAVAGL
ncbi:MAG: DUF2726 domain-containing protein [Solimonas sp.]